MIPIRLRCRTIMSRIQVTKTTWKNGSKIFFVVCLNLDQTHIYMDIILLTILALTALVKSKIIKRVPVLPRGWRLRFQVKPLAVVRGWSNILYATKGGNVGHYGFRTPGVWFHSGSSRLHICSAVSGNANYCYNSHALPLHKFSTIVVQQVQRRRMYGNRYYGHRYHFEVYINGVRKISVVNTKPLVFRNVKYYASDPWHPASLAIVRKFHLTTYRHKY